MKQFFPPDCVQWRTFLSIKTQKFVFLSTPLFESHADALTPELFERYTQKRLKFIASEVKRRLGDKAVPMSIFCKGAHFMNNSFLDSEDWLSMIKMFYYYTYHM